MSYLLDKLAAERAAKPRPVIIIARNEAAARAYAELWHVPRDRVLFPRSLADLKGIDKDTANVVVTASWSAHPQARAFEGWVQSVINAAAETRRRQSWLERHRSSPIN